MGNRSFLFCSVSAALLLWSGNVGAQCVMNQDCATLGYTKTAAECSGTGIKCPFGDKWSCVAKPEPDRKCQIGWIYYSDKTCSLDVVSGKTALGVVVYVNPDGIGGQVMAARDVGASYWCGYSGYYDVTDLPNYTTQESASRDYDSCSNTDKIVAYFVSSKGAAHMVRNYAPTTETKGKWCLPAAGILTNIYNNKSAVQAGIAKLGGRAYPSCCTSSSTKESSDKMWVSGFDNSYGLVSSYQNSSVPVRPVLEF